MPPKHDHDAAGHVLAAVIAHAFDDGRRAAIAHREPLAGEAIDEDFARRRAVEQRIADDDVFLGIEGRARRRLHDDPAAGEALAQVVVGVADELQRHALGEEGPETLAGRAAESQLESAVGQSLAAVVLHDAVAEDRAHGAVDVANRHFQARCACLLPGPAPSCSMIFQSRWSLCMSLCGANAAQRAAVRLVGLGEHGREVQALGLPMLDRLVETEPLDLADHVVELAEAQFGHDRGGRPRPRR